MFASNVCGQIVHPRRPRHARADGLGLLGGKLLGLDHVLLEDQHRSRHQADFVLLVGRGNLDGVIAAGKLPHGADHLEDRRHDRAIGQIDHRGGNADADTHQHPEQGHQETGFRENRRAVSFEAVLLPRNHAARTRACVVLGPCEDVEQLVGAGRGFVGQKPLRHVPAVRGPDLEHFLRQRREFGAGFNERIEGLLLIARHLRAALRQRVEFLLIERPELLELVLEVDVRGQQIGADRADRHRQAAAHVGKIDQQALARIGRGDAAFLVDDRSRLLQHEFGERRGLGRQQLGGGLLVDGVGDGLGLVLRVTQFVEQRLGLLPVHLVLLDRPLARETVHLGAARLDVLPQHGAFGLECVVAGDQPAAQRRKRCIDPCHQVAGGHRGRNPKVDGPVGGFADCANLDDGGADHGGQQHAQHAETQYQSSTDVQLQERHGKFLPRLRWKQAVR